MKKIVTMIGLLSITLTATVHANPSDRQACLANDQLKSISDTYVNGGFAETAKKGLTELGGLRNTDKLTNRRVGIAAFSFECRSDSMNFRNDVVQFGLSKHVWLEINDNQQSNYYDFAHLLYFVDSKGKIVSLGNENDRSELLCTGQSRPIENAVASIPNSDYNVETENVGTWRKTRLNHSIDLNFQENYSLSKASTMFDVTLNLRASYQVPIFEKNSPNHRNIADKESSLNLSIPMKCKVTSMPFEFDGKFTINFDK